MSTAQAPKHYLWMDEPPVCGECGVPWADHERALELHDELVERVALKSRVHHRMQHDGPDWERCEELPCSQDHALLARARQKVPS